MSAPDHGPHRPRALRLAAPCKELSGTVDPCTESLRQVDPDHDERDRALGACVAPVRGGGHYPRAERETPRTATLSRRNRPSAPRRSVRHSRRSRGGKYAPTQDRASARGTSGAEGALARVEVRQELIHRRLGVLRELRAVFGLVDAELGTLAQVSRQWGPVNERGRGAPRSGRGAERRIADGVCPVQRRTAWVKAAASWNPSSHATWEIESLASSRYRIASSRRISSSTDAKLRPSSASRRARVRGLMLSFRATRAA